MFIDLVTPSDIALFTGKENPDNIAILISRASEIITIKTRRNYNPNNVAHAEAVKLAICSQVQDWIDREVSAVADNNVASYSLGSLSVTYANNDIAQNRLCRLSTVYLNSQYLLYKGMR